MRKLISASLITIGLIGLLMAGSDVGQIENQVIINTSGLLLFGLSSIVWVVFFVGFNAFKEQASSN